MDDAATLKIHERGLTDRPAGGVELGEGVGVRNCAGNWESTSLEIEERVERFLGQVFRRLAEGSE
jgi:hypothetical protein